MGYIWDRLKEYNTLETEHKIETLQLILWSEWKIYIHPSRRKTTGLLGHGYTLSEEQYLESLEHEFDNKIKLYA